MDLSIFKTLNVLRAPNAMMAAVFSPSNLGMFFLLTLYLQGVEHYSASPHRAAFLPFPGHPRCFVSTRMAQPPVGPPDSASGAS